MLSEQCEPVFGLAGDTTVMPPADAIRPARRNTQDEYDKKARELKARQIEMALPIEQHEQGDGEFRATLETLISVDSRAADIFARSKTEQTGQLVAFVFSNLRLRGKKLEYALRSPFDLMVNRTTYASWLGDLDSNQDCTVQSREFYR